MKRLNRYINEKLSNDSISKLAFIKLKLQNSNEYKNADDFIDGIAKVIDINGFKLMINKNCKVIDHW